MRSLPLAMILAIGGGAALSSCGPERALSGVWQQVSCGEDDATACDNDLLYELHLGRFGDNVAGVVVRYTFKGPELDNFGNNECGCFVIVSGRATDERLAFELFRPERPGLNSSAPSDFSCPWPDRPSEPLVNVPECAGRQLRLTAASDDRLEGVIECAGGDAQPIVFRRVTGRTRDRCVQPDPES